jgi:hypothetical protein
LLLLNLYYLGKCACVRGYHKLLDVISKEEIEEILIEFLESFQDYNQV